MHLFDERCAEKHRKVEAAFVLHGKTSIIIIMCVCVFKHCRYHIDTGQFITTFPAGWSPQMVV